MELVKFLFSSIWHWIGGLFYLSLIVAAIATFKPIEIKFYQHEGKK